MNSYKGVKTNEGLSKEFHVTEGILQGETLNPLLFSLFISDLEIFLVFGKSGHFREAAQ